MSLRSVCFWQTANHVLGQHQYRPPGDDGMTMTSELQDRYKPVMLTKVLALTYGSALLIPRSPGMIVHLHLLMEPCIKKEAIAAQ